MRSKLYIAYAEAAAAIVTSDGTLPASVVPGRSVDYITFGHQRQPVLLLSFVSGTGLKRPPISLLHMTVEFGIRFRVRAPRGVAEGDFVVISLRSSDLGFAEAFCLVAEAILAALPNQPSASDIEKAIREFVEILSSVSLPSSRAVAGLWAELWLMHKAEDSQAAVMSWHRNPVERFDFSFATHFVEVKATEKEERSHDFSYEQLRRSEVPIRVASLRLRRAQCGTSIADLVAELHKRLSPELRMKLVKNVFGAIGNAISEASEIRFDEEFAESNLRVINAARVPVVVIPAGSPISAVRFRVNLGDSSLAPFLVETSSQRVLELS